MLTARLDFDGIQKSVDAMTMLGVPYGEAVNRAPEMAREQAAAVRNPDPRYVFHLALAHYQAGNMQKARQEFMRVDPQTLRKQILTDNDRKMLDELQGKFGL